MLLTSGLLSQWDGRLTHRLPGEVDAPVLGVVLLEPDGDSRVLWWPSWVVQSLDLKVEKSSFAAPRVNGTRPETHKSRWSLSYGVRKTPEAPDIDVSTLSSRTMGLGGLFFLVGLALRNMWWSGAPWRIDARDVVLPAALAKPGQPIVPPTAPPPPPKPGPPPPRRRTGRGRR